jgi:hypothetical protein
MPEGVAFIFDGGLVTDAEVAALVLTDPEILSAGLHSLTELAEKVKPTLARRLGVALQAAVSGTLALCEDGKRVAG